MLKRNFRRFDIGVSLIAGDRSTLYASLFSKYSVGVASTKPKYWMQRALLNAWLPYDAVNNHMVMAHIKVLQLLDVEATGNVGVAWNREDEIAVQRAVAGPAHESPYVVVHPCAKFSYKAWTLDGWVELCRWLRARNFHIYISGGPDPAEADFIARLLGSMDATGISNLAGKLTLPQLSYLLSGASLYVGPDTGVTHIAAGLGTPTVTLFGPSSPVRWGPWPHALPLSKPSPWNMHGSQQRNNVVLLQGQGGCVPCLEEGCERHVNSLSQCLQQLPPSTVIAAAERLLTEEHRS